MNVDSKLKITQKIIHDNIIKKYGSLEDIPIPILKYYILYETLSRIDDNLLQKAARKVYNQYDYYDKKKNPYWLILSQYLIYVKKQCKICKKPTQLMLHHRTYKHLGIEYKYMEDFDVLCWKCHIDERRSNKLPENCYGIKEVLITCLKDIPTQKSGKNSGLEN